MSVYQRGRVKPALLQSHHGIAHVVFKTTAKGWKIFSKVQNLQLIDVVIGAYTLIWPWATVTRTWSVPLNGMVPCHI